VVHDCFHAAGVGLHFLKEFAELEVLLGVGCVVLVGEVAHLLVPVADLTVGELFKPVHPTLAHAVLELLLLPPEHFIGQIGVFRAVEGLTQNLLFNLIFGVVVGHLEQRVDLVHDQLEEFGVQEGHAGFNPPGHHDFVGAQTVEQVQPLQLALGFVVELVCIGRLVELQLAAEYFIRTLAGQHELDVHACDAFSHELHGSAAAYGLVLGLYVLDDVLHKHQALFHREVEFVVLGADEVSHFSASHQVCRLFQAHVEQLEAGPLALGDPLCDAGRERGIQAA